MCHPYRRCSGQALIFVTMSLIFMFGVAGLAIDLGWGYYLKARVQTAADAAVTAAAVYAKYHGDTCGTVTCNVSYTCIGTTPPTTSLQAGCLYATANGPSSFSATMIENNTVPPGVTGNAPTMWIRATVSTTAPNFFLYGSGYQTASIAAQATAGVTLIPAASCIYVLDPSAAQALTVQGTSNITTNGCGVYVNSNSGSALYMNGSATIVGTTKVVGGTSIGGLATITPAATTGVSPTADPLANLAAPTFSGCDHTNYTLGNGNTATINPGVYCGGITLTNNSTTLTLNPGNYILDGGGLTVSNSSILIGSHVMFYNTKTGSNTIGPISVGNSSTITLSAPNSGVYEGVLFFQDRNLTYVANNSFANSATSNVTGAFYFPTTSFTFIGSNNTAIKSAFIAKTMALIGNSSLQSDTTGVYTGLAKTTAALIQ